MSHNCITLESRMIAAFALFVSLGLDTLAIAIGLGVKGLPRARWLQVGLVFAFFEGLMPIVGLLIGQHASGWLGVVAGYAAAIILIVLGVMEIRETFGDDDASDKNAITDATTLRTLLWLGLSISLDELAIGFSLGVLHVRIGLALAYIAAQALVLTFVGLWIGTRAGAELGERAELAAGVLLLLLGIALLISQATGVQFL